VETVTKSETQTVLSRFVNSAIGPAVGAKLSLITDDSTGKSESATTGGFIWPTLRSPFSIRASRSPTHR
jgi:hypothetical protein